MFKCFLYLSTWLLIAACEPFDLTRKEFPVCVKPSAEIGYTIGYLDVTLFVDKPQGDIGAIGWDPGDGKGVSRVGSRVTYTYEKAGTYTVTLNIANQCDDKLTVTKQITVGK